MTLAIFEKTKFYDNQSETVVGRMKVTNKGIPDDKLIRLKSKRYSMLSDDGKEPNREKGVNIATEINEFKDTLFDKKVITHKMKRIKIKNHWNNRNQQKIIIVF